jgi:hypothetical protein
VAAPRIIDYGRIEPGWRAGLLSVQQLADEYEAATGQKVTLQAINKHFKKLGIPRDLAAKIEAKAAAMVQAAMVQGKVQIDGSETIPDDVKIIASAAKQSANIQLAHRRTFEKLRERADRYEIELEDCGEDLLKKTAILKNLAEIQVKITDAERKSFGMDRDALAEDDPLQALLSAIAGKVIGPRSVG